MNRNVARARLRISAVSAQPRASPAHSAVRPKPEVAILTVHDRPVLHLARGRTRLIPKEPKAGALDFVEELLVCSLKCIRGVL